MKRDFSAEFEFLTSRSSGPGGQNVNKVNSKVSLRFDLEQSALLSDDEKSLLRLRLKSHLSGAGILLITSQVSRSQHINRELCVEKFYQLVEKALLRPKIRRKTTPSAAAKTRRLELKRLNAEKKQGRRPPEY